MSEGCISMVFKSRCARALCCLDGEMCGNQSEKAFSENILAFSKRQGVAGVSFDFLKISTDDLSKVIAISVDDYFGKDERNR